MADAYGWPAGAVGDPYEVIPRLMERNAAIQAGQPYEPFPGRRPPIVASEDLTLDFSA